jgi:hypothetical protein
MKFNSLVEPRFGAATAQRALETLHSIEDIQDMATAFSSL